MSRGKLEFAECGCKVEIKTKQINLDVENTLVIQFDQEIDDD
ncbi:hypothetical protein GM3708_2268 [Geminocystis sp. NIES-3708]|nr:hypothetical protein GM3708_2268 [Geminocystis sp. NIES-3708]